MTRSKLLTLHPKCSQGNNGFRADAVPLTGSRREPRERPDTASGHCTFSRQACSGASSTQSY